MTNKILCVDDDPNILAGIQRNLRKSFNIVIANSGAQALTIMQQQGPFAVVVADMQMPGMNGVEFLKKAEQLAPGTVRMMLTGNADQKTAVEAVNEGHVFRFLSKPCPPETLSWALEAGLQHHDLLAMEKELLEKTLNGSVRLLVELIAMVEPVSAGKSNKLRDYMKLFAQHFQARDSWALELAAMLSQIGFITLPESLRIKLKTFQTVTAAEQTLLKRLPEVGRKLLANIPRLESICDMILYQTKNYDGTGFPFDDLKGEDIPIGSRILKVLSNLVDMEAEGVPRGRALEMMQKREGCYDPRVLDAAFACFDVYLDKNASQEKTPQIVRLHNLQCGQVLMSNITTNDDILIVEAGARVTAALLERLHNFAELSGIKEPIVVEG